MRSSQTQHRSSRPFQCEDGSPQSTQTNRLNPSSLFEQPPDKACPLGSSLRPHPAMVTAESPGPWGQAKYVPDCPGFSCFLPSVDGVGCCVRVFFLTLMYLCPNFVVLCLGEGGGGGRQWGGRGLFCVRLAKNVHLGLFKCHRPKLGEPSLCRTQVLMHLEALVRFRANEITWHLASAVKEEGGIKATDTLGNSSIQEAVKRVIRRTR